jgi:aspartyl-tRNA(Asn)/glutamyl-tRNA(Gln) amidotransferase subunit A
MSDPQPFSSIVELDRALSRRECSAVELARLYLARIERADEQLHAFVRTDPERALARAAEADRRLAAGERRGPLDGIPLAVKDLFEMEGDVTTFGSAAWRERRSTGTAAAVELLERAGMIVLGKTHMTEFAFGAWGANPLMGTPWNPWDLARHRVPGGSSGGSAVAVAAGLAPAGLGSDTGGSVRVPAALNGITGLKTTYGLVSLDNALPLSPTLDSIGPLTRTAEDAAIVTDALMGAGTRLRDALGRHGEKLAGTRIVVLREQDFSIAVQRDILDAFRGAQAVFRDLGAELVERPFPFDLTDLGRRNGRLIAAEAWRVHAAYAEDAALAIGPAVRERVIAGKSIDSAEYQAVLADHRRQSAAWAEWLADADALLLPATPMVACPIEEVDEKTTPLVTFTRAGNFFGACALALPAGISAGGLPVGVQLKAKPFADGVLLRLGRAFQDVTDWHGRTPDLSRLFGQ